MLPLQDCEGPEAAALYAAALAALDALNDGWLCLAAGWRR